jgi:DNA topoisomerase-1
MSSKKYSTTTTLVIVESPAKCKKIEEYLGPGYKCLASFGHLRELPSLKNIEFENNFKPTYTVIDNTIKKRQIEVLRKAIKESNDVILACDADREGEGICWNLCELFKLDIEKTKRIVFNEITERALLEAIRNPKRIDMNMVHSQQARQILDLLVGFKITPNLWKYITRKSENSLSAGRCQTPALRLIYDNYKEVLASPGKIVYNISGYFTNMNLLFELNKQIETSDEVIDYLNESISFSHIYHCSSPVKVKKDPPEPLTTSRIQQIASNEMHCSPKDTMRICQSLYEGGYITYMRTDSKKYSKEFIECVKEYIVKNHDEKYINEEMDKWMVGFNEKVENIEEQRDNPVAKKRGRPKKGEVDTEKISNKIKDKQEGKKALTQDAHEAIRPTNISLKELPITLDVKERRMYKLIWETSLESCMSSAIYSTINASISAHKGARFVRNCELCLFPGWRVVRGKGLGNSDEYNYLQTMRNDSNIVCKKMLANVSVKDAKMHYTEAKLVQLLEEKGIGRPSTFSMLVDKIQERGYVKKDDIKGREFFCNEYELVDGEIFETEVKKQVGNEKAKLVIQPLGIIVSEFLETHFSDLFNYDYTRTMEDNLDLISKGNMVWHSLCGECNTQIDKLIHDLEEKSQNKYEYKFDDNHSVIIGKHGLVLRCIEKHDNKDVVTFKPVKNDINIEKMEKGEYILDDIIDNKTPSQREYILGKFNEDDVILRKGKFGIYLIWGKNSKTLKEFGNRPIESITLEDVQPFLKEETELGSKYVREISPNLSIRRSAKGNYIFFKTEKMKKPQFFNIETFTNETKEDYKICDINILKSWIKEKYNIY